MCAKYMATVTFIAICIIVNMALNKHIQNIFAAAVCSATLTAVLYQIIGFLVVGSIDPCFIVAFAARWVIAFFISFALGLLVTLQYARCKKNEKFGKIYEVWNKYFMLAG